ncbi:MAG: thioesterase family protein [Candidatus Zixiibacteriota bacterium]
MAIFRNRITVRLQDTDAAGILFFANQFVYAHETYEKLMEDIGVSFAHIFEHESFLIPLVHAEADYNEKLRVGQPLEVELTVENIGTTSFALAYVLKSEDDSVVGTCRTVHVTAGKSDLKKIPLPDRLREGLERYRKA